MCIAPEIETGSQSRTQCLVILVWLRIRAAGIAVNEASETVECRWADVVFDSLGVHSRNFRINTERQQKPVDQLVTLPALLRQPPTLWCQFDRSVRRCDNQTVAFQPLDDPDHRDVRDAETLCEVRHTALPVGIGERSDCLDVILGRFGRVITPRPFVRPGSGCVCHAQYYTRPRRDPRRQPQHRARATGLLARMSRLTT